METNLISVLIFFSFILLVFWMMDNKKIKTITASCVAVLSALPIVGIIKALIKYRNNNK